MNDKDLLFKFEEKYPFLYEIMESEVPLYTCLRDDVLFILNGGTQKKSNIIHEKKGKIFLKRIIDGLFKIYKMKKSQTLIFTSSVYRRDHGRNLAAEYLLDRYPDAVIFEWPSRNESFDRAYFTDKQKTKYCPLDFYVVIYKIVLMIRKKYIRKESALIRDKLITLFDQSPHVEKENERAAKEYILQTLPNSCVSTRISHEIFKMIFRKYKKINCAIDFWGSARENIFPVLNGDFEKIELQHGLIASVHPGYIYPKFVRNLKLDFFQRSLLVYGEKTKALLTQQSIFHKEKIEVIGNPRIIKYKQEFTNKKSERSIVLFTSQPFEQDGAGENYYKTVVPILNIISNYLKSLDSMELAIKLHPRENTSIKELYSSLIPNVKVFDNSSELYEILQSCYLHITVSSTTLLEAASFGVPTILVSYGDIKCDDKYGFNVLCIRKPDEVDNIMEKLASNYEDYTHYLMDKSSQFS